MIIYYKYQKCLTRTVYRIVYDRRPWLCKMVHRQYVTEDDDLSENWVSWENTLSYLETNFCILKNPHFFCFTLFTFLICLVTRLKFFDLNVALNNPHGPFWKKSWLGKFIGVIKISVKSRSRVLQNILHSQNKKKIDSKTCKIWRRCVRRGDSFSTHNPELLPARFDVFNGSLTIRRAVRWFVL